MSTENFFRPSNKKDCCVVVLANILESVGIPLDHSENYAHSICNPCGRKDYFLSVPQPNNGI